MEGCLSSHQKMKTLGSKRAIKCLQLRLATQIPDTHKLMPVSTTLKY